VNIKKFHPNKFSLLTEKNKKCPLIKCKIYILKKITETSINTRILLLS